MKMQVVFTSLFQAEVRLTQFQRCILAPERAKHEARFCDLSFNAPNWCRYAVTIAIDFAKISI